MKNLLEYVGLEPGRIHFSWISSAEGEKFARVAKEVYERVNSLGPVKRLVKERVEVA